MPALRDAADVGERGDAVQPRRVVLLGVRRDRRSGDRRQIRRERGIAAVASAGEILLAQIRVTGHGGLGNSNNSRHGFSRRLAILR